MSAIKIETDHVRSLSVKLREQIRYLMTVRGGIASARSNLNVRIMARRNLASRINKAILDLEHVDRRLAQLITVLEASANKYEDEDNRLKNRKLDTDIQQLHHPLQNLLRSLFKSFNISTAAADAITYLSRHTPYYPFLQAIQRASTSFDQASELLKQNSTAWLEAMKAQAASRRTSNPDEYVTRSSQPDFVKIKDEDSGTLYYGGDQEWFSEYTQRFGGCGPTAAANIMAYMASTDPKLAKLYGYDLNDISKEDFAKYMEEVYQYVTPTEVPFINRKSNLADENWMGIAPSLGITRLSHFAKGVERFAASKGVPLKAQWSDKKPTFENAVDYIRSGLEKDRPVALLNMFDAVEMRYTLPENGQTIITDYQQHWVTITGMIENKKTGEVTLEVSTWGAKGTISFNELWDQDWTSYWFPEAILYFELEE